MALASMCSPQGEARRGVGRCYNRVHANHKREDGMSSSHEPVVYINGEFVPEGQATVSVFVRGFRWGDGV